MDGKEIFAKTLWAEARGELLEGQKEVARVIRKRAFDRKMSIEKVCLQSRQFSCWDGVKDIVVKGHQDEKAYWKIREWSDELYDKELKADPLGPDHYLNPAKFEKLPEWTANCIELGRIGNHVFYRARTN